MLQAKNYIHIEKKKQPLTPWKKTAIFEKKQKLVLLRQSVVDVLPPKLCTFAEMPRGRKTAR